MDQPNEGRLLEQARERLGLSQNQAAQRAGMSGTRWRQIVKGVASSEGTKVPVHGNAKTVARMAAAVGVTPEELEQAGRSDAAHALYPLLDKQQDDPEVDFPGIWEAWRLGEITEEERDEITAYLAVKRAQREAREPQRKTNRRVG